MGNSVSVPSHDNCTRDMEKKKRYVDRFTDLEFRAFRAMKMNFDESYLFDKWSRWSEYCAAAVGMFGVLASTTLSIVRYKSNKLQLTWILIGIPVAGIIEFRAQGTFDLIPSLADRAQRHVNAGAEWTRIHRMAKMYRSELEATLPEAVQWNEQRKCFQELLEAYKQASMCTVIRKEIYEKYDEPEIIFEKLDRREKQLAEYKKHVGIAGNDPTKEN